jgi:hypothetical protein
MCCFYLLMHHLHVDMSACDERGEGNYALMQNSYFTKYENWNHHLLDEIYAAGCCINIELRFASLYNPFPIAMDVFVIVCCLHSVLCLQWKVQGCIWWANDSLWTWIKVSISMHVIVMIYSHKQFIEVGRKGEKSGKKLFE